MFIDFQAILILILKILAASSESAIGGFDPMEFFILCSLGFMIAGSHNE
jgi:hypothetical protein